MAKGLSFYDWTGYDRDSLREKEGVYRFKDEHNRVFENYYGVEIIVWYEDEAKTNIIGFQIDHIQNGIVTYRANENGKERYDVYRHETLVPPTVGKRQLLRMNKAIEKTTILSFLDREQYLEKKIKDYIRDKINQAPE